MNKHSKYLCGLTLCWLTLCALSAHALELPSLFSDHMVLQRDQPARIWGQAPALHTVTVEVNENEYTTQANERGYWELKLPPRPAGGPYQLTVSADQTRTLNDVYFGDVWIAGGQSNMEWKMNAGITNQKAALADANYPTIRFFEVPNTIGITLQQQLPPSKWVKASTESVQYFSAVAWFFAKHLHENQAVAVGIIESNWGGTPAEAWMDIHKLSAVNGYAEKAHAVLATKNWAERIAQNDARRKEKYRLIDDLALAIETGAHKSTTDVAHWNLVTLPNSEPLSDLNWLRKTFTLANKPTDNAELFLGDIVQNAFIFVNGQFIAKEDWRHSESRHKIPAELLRKGPNQITLRAANDWDNRVFVGARTDAMWLKTPEHTVDLTGHWHHNNQLQPPLPKVERLNETPSFLYNAMIHPLLPYTARGVIWYQGESNVGTHTRYHELFTAMINNWRARAGNPQLPFLFVQLAAFKLPQTLQPASGWAYLRDAQRKTTSLPHTAMATAIDVGEIHNVHPANKYAVGHRLWRQAASLVYGNQITPSGPDFTHATVEGSHMRIHFNYAQGLTTLDNTPPLGFIIAGADKAFYVANARIEGATLVLSHPEVSMPVAARYAWADYPQVNLVNKEKLPAIPFRTDNWAASEVKPR
ncbi:hypothetical protein L1F30_02075 [Simiduia sp. 21SJ11W-1]|uniref:sialate O-acetylesterase n=1 Tax=Simiduia sp. 21SJ11W-1 TaxID=2909669 RepID=UPI00209E0D66|nr:sialate O-acetylesterase [Simiduia sp. 21SJ11W-1]UTA48343.1 hypothetical protein L1F30_02075 [Simiduia sp. 21SJ11W-1]